MAEISGVTVVPYSDEYVKMHEEFAIKFWPNKMRRRIEAYNRWKFRGPEKGKVDGLIIAVYEDKIVGQMGLIPVMLKNKDQVFKAQWICDWMVDSNYRSLGIGSKLTEAAMNRDGIITLGNNPSTKAEQVMLKMGFKHLKCGRIMIFPMDPVQIVKWGLPEKLDMAAPFLSKLVQPYFSYKKKKARKGGTDFTRHEWREAVNDIKKRQNSIDYPQILHDEKFLQWRADGLKDYSGKIPALRSSNGSYALYSPFASYLDVYDWYCRTYDDLEKLFSGILELAEENGSKMIQLMANNEQEEVWLSRLGFIRTRSREMVLHYSKEKYIDGESKFYFALFDTDLNL